MNANVRLDMEASQHKMVQQRVVGSLNCQVSFAKETLLTHKRDQRTHKRLFNARKRPYEHTKETNERQRQTRYGGITA